MIAIRKRMATNEMGGKSRKPTLIASQVELQTAQSVNHATGTPHPTRGRQLRDETGRVFVIPRCFTSRRDEPTGACEHVRYITHFALRFSLKAAMPSLASSDSRACR